MGESADQLDHPRFPGLPSYQCFSAGKLICFVSKVAERNIDIQARGCSEGCGQFTHASGPVSAAQSNPPTNSQSTSISEELNHAFQIPHGPVVGPVQQPSALDTSPGNNTCSEIFQMAAGFSNTQTLVGQATRSASVQCLSQTKLSLLKQRSKKGHKIAKVRKVCHNIIQST